jgi:hypothetical protein
MGWFDDDNWLNPGLALGPIGSFAWDSLDLGGKHADAARNAYLQGELNRRAVQKQNQLNLLGQKRAPVMAPEMEARIKALEEESKPGPLVTNPEFQGNRAQLVTGGRAALSSVQNRQAATGTTGGFSNVGSMQNVYDRLGAQLGQLGQQATIRKEQKRDTAAQARQAFADAQTQHQNAILDAKMAIESGDANALNDAYARMYAAQTQADQARKAMMVNVGSTAVSTFAGMPRSPASAPEAGGNGSVMYGGNPNAGTYMSNTYAQDLYNAPQGYRPAYQMRR